MQNIISALKYFLKTFITVIPRIVYRSTLSLVLDIKGSQAFLHDILNALDLRNEDKVIKSVDLVDVIGKKNFDIKIEGSYYNKRSSDTRDLFELANIGYLIKVVNPKSIFEIGTFIGRTTRFFAINSGDNCKIYTLDLHQSVVSHSIGCDYKNTVESKKIIQLYGNSLSFNFTLYLDAMDFVWIDACHDYKYVKYDTESALKMCKKGGWIGWHDYRVTAWWSGVTKYVRELSQEYPHIMHIKGTTIAIMRKS